jgi:hypothetical protein
VAPTAAFLEHCCDYTAELEPLLADMATFALAQVGAWDGARAWGRWLEENQV